MKTILLLFLVGCSSSNPAFTGSDAAPIQAARTDAAQAPIVWPDAASDDDAAPDMLGEADGAGTRADAPSGDAIAAPAPDLVACGECKPGDVQAGDCDQCSQQTCGKDCKWSACALKQTSQCEWKNGTNVRPCDCKVDHCAQQRCMNGQPPAHGCTDSCQNTACVCLG